MASMVGGNKPIGPPWIACSASMKTTPPCCTTKWRTSCARTTVQAYRGVCHYRDGQREYRLAFWPTDPGKERSVKFSVAKYGERQAFVLAVTARQCALERLEQPCLRQPRKRGLTLLRSAAADSPLRPDPRIQRVSVRRRHLRVAFYDGRSLAVPLAWFPALQQAETEARQQWALNEAGEAIVWPKLGVTITAAELLKLA